MNVDGASAQESAHAGTKEAFEEAPCEESVGRVGSSHCCDGTTAGCCLCVFCVCLISLKAEVCFRRIARGAGCDGDTEN